MREQILSLTVSKRRALTLLASLFTGVALILGLGIKTAETQKTVRRYYLAIAVGLAAILFIAKPVWAAYTLVFAPAQNYTVGANPESVTTADFNGDGKADLAVAALNSNQYGKDDVFVLLNKGDGTFAPAQKFQAGYSPDSVISADFNEDGKADLATANYGLSGTPEASVLLGNGDGTFQAAQNFVVGTDHPDNPDHSQSLTSTDFNGDGNLDLAVANRYGPDEIAVLLGNGDGTFGAPAILDAGSGPYSVISSDLNGDSKADLAVANADSNDVSVLLGNGDGTFGTAQNFDAGGPVTSVIGADLNKDGKTDLAVAADLKGVSVLLGNGDGTFGAAQNVGLSSAFRVTSTDFDRDGTPDLAAVDARGTSASVLLGNGDGTFVAPQSFEVGLNPRSLTSADFNGDRLPDLAVPPSTSDKVAVLLSIPDTTKPSSTATSSPQANSAGWNNSAVKVTLSATDPNNGSGVNKITYSASGAQNIAKTDASGSSVDVTLDQEGTTTLTYYATDNAGNVEDAKTLTVKIDKTAPTVTEVSPSDPNTPVARSTNVTATFSEAIDPKTLVTTPTNSADPNVGTSTTFTLTKQGSTKPITATVSYDATNKKATLKPSVALAPSTTYTATVSGAKDMADNTVVKKVWSFTTAKK